MKKVVVVGVGGLGKSFLERVAHNHCGVTTVISLDSTPITTIKQENLLTKMKPYKASTPKSRYHK